MDPALTAALVSLLGTAAVGIASWFGRANKESMAKISSSIANIEAQVTTLRIELPTKYVTKEEMVRHIMSEENWQRNINEQLRDIREEISSLRDWSHHR